MYLVSSNPADLSKELDDIRRALQSCLFPTWALNRLQHNSEHKHNSRDPIQTGTNNHNTNGTTDCNKQRNIFMVVPYIQGLGETFKKTCKKQGIHVHFKGTNTIKSLLMAPKDKDIKFQKSGSFTSTSAHMLTVQRNILVNLAGHLGTDSRNISKHNHPFINTPVPQDTQLAQTVFPLFTGNPRLNQEHQGRNLGTFQLTHVWDQILQDTQTLHLKLTTLLTLSKPYPQLDPLLTHWS